MGLIKAGLGALGGTLADQWKEFFYCDSMDKDVMVIGACNVAEIWDKTAWDDFNNAFDTTELMEVMGEL